MTSARLPLLQYRQIESICGESKHKPMKRHTLSFSRDFISNATIKKFLSQLGIKWNSDFGCFRKCSFRFRTLFIHMPSLSIIYSQLSFPSFLFQLEEVERIDVWTPRQDLAKFISNFFNELTLLRMSKIGSFLFRFSIRESFSLRLKTAHW